tara:strand:+ start:131 stop:373 length:243 start_codon:yes stop_codon:yes gene_type:complete
MKTLLFASILIAASYAQSNDTQTIQVASLNVKERLKSIEEINVTAKIEATQTQATSQKLKQILAEAQRQERDFTPSSKTQ